MTEDGKVFSVLHNWRGYGRRELGQTLNADGYPSVRLSVNGGRRRIAVYKLVAESFLPPRPSEKHQVRHLDGNKMNSCAENLAWGTAKENAWDRDKHGTTSRGAKHSNAIKNGMGLEQREKISEAMKNKPWSEKRRAAYHG